MNFNGEAAGGRLLQALLAGNFGRVSIATGAAACTTAWTALREREEVSLGGVTANPPALTGAFLGGMTTFWIGVLVTAGGRHRRQNIVVGFINFIASLVAWVVASAYYGKFEPGHVFDIYNELP